MTDEVEAQAGAASDRRLDRSSPAPLAVAVSGGGDSMALLHLAADWAREAGRPLLVLTVDHGLNADSADWARAVAAAAARLGLACRILRWDGPKPATGLPAAARAARHALLAEAARQAGARVLLMGHTADDLAEGALMRADGSAVGDPREWSPSPAWPEGRGVFLLRPLLACSREGLRTFLGRRGEGWIDDPANRDPRSHRARARQCFPAHPRESGAPSLSSEHVQLRNLGPRFRGDERGLLEANDELLALEGASLALSLAAACASGRSSPVRTRLGARLCERLQGQTTASGTLAGARIRREHGVVALGRELGRAGAPALRAEPGRELVWDGRFTGIPSEAGTVHAMVGRQARLSKAERASLKAVPSWARPTLPVLETPSGAVRLLSEARPLVLERLRAACGVYEREADLPMP